MWRIGIAFIAGQCLIHSLPSLPKLWPYGVLLAAALCLAAILRSVLIAVALLGVGWAWAHALLRLSDDLPSALEGRDVLVSGRIASILDTRALDPQFEFDVEHADDHRVPARLRLAWYDTDERPRAGESWRLVVRLKRRNGFANPGGFDYEGYLFRERIGATGYVRADARNVKLGGPSASYVVLRVRAWLAERIALAVGPSDVLGILQGLAIGDTQSMRPEQWRVFAATGTSHLMAISGLHIGMVAALAAMLGGSIARVPQAQRWRITAIHGQALAGIGAALGYSLLAGMSVPTQRTLVMLCIYFAARWQRRALGVGNALGLALVGVAIVDPFAMLSAGTWLSFGAVAIIVLATAGRLRADRALVNFARVQWAITLGLLPILVIAFGGMSMISPIANAVAVPLFTLVVVPLVLIGTAAASVSLAGGELLRWTAQLLEACWPVMEWLARQPLSMWYVPEMPWPHHAMLAVGTLLFVLPGAIPLRCVAAALCLPAASFQPPAPERGAYELAMLDVGQGLAVVLRTHSHTLVYDAGPAFRTGRDTGELVLLPYLRSRGIRTIDRLVISHGDLDHAGGARSLPLGMTIRAQLVGPSVQTASPHAVQCVDGQRWMWDGVVFEILHPGAELARGSDNDSSCVLRVTGKGGTALITGDIEAQAEAELLARYAVPADIVTVAHHGSGSSSTAAFVAATGARLALVSVGYRNRWNFPKPEVVERWRAAGADVVTTIESGAIELTVPPNGAIEMRRFRHAHRRYWSSR